MEIPEEIIKGAFPYGWPDPKPEALRGLTTETLGQLYAKDCPSEESMKDPDDAPSWVWVLMHHLVRESGPIALDGIEWALRCELTGFQMGCIAAGPLEEVIAGHGAQVIDRIEEVAGNSARFRYALSGVWPLGRNTEGEVWQRVQRAIGSGPFLDSGVPVPPVDL